MSKDRFIERQAEVCSAIARLQEAVAQTETAILRDAVIQRIYQHIVQNHAPLLGRMAECIQALAWD